MLFWLGVRFGPSDDMDGLEAKRVQAGTHSTDCRRAAGGDIRV